MESFAARSPSAQAMIEPGHVYDLPDLIDLAANQPRNARGVASNTGRCRQARDC
jgi:hypothetical protein